MPLVQTRLLWRDDKLIRSNPNARSAFLALPTEVRFHIYKFLLTHHDPIKLEHVGDRVRMIKDKVDIELSTQIFRCSRFILNEAKTILFACNTFDMSSKGALGHTLSRIGVLDRQTIKTLCRMDESSLSMRRVAELRRCSGLEKLEIVTYIAPVVGFHGPLSRMPVNILEPAIKYEADQMINLGTMLQNLPKVEVTIRAGPYDGPLGRECAILDVKRDEKLPRVYSIVFNRITATPLKGFPTAVIV